MLGNSKRPFPNSQNSLLTFEKMLSVPSFRV